MFYKLLPSLTVTYDKVKKCRKWCRKALN